MIDTIKMYCVIDKKTYDIISSNSVIKTSYHAATGEVFYNIVNDHLKGSYDSSLSVRLDCGAKYRLAESYVVVVERKLS